MNHPNKHHDQPTKAVIYCRISSLKQLDEGDGLQSQATRCEEFARRKGYEVIETFYDRGVSGGDIDRPGMRDMLRFLLAHKGERHAVIIDDLSRFSRDVTVHWKLRDLLADAGGVLESPTMKFGDTSDDKLIENMLASVSQHQREKNREQSWNRSKARLQNGYWVDRTVIGYKYKQTRGNGKILVRDEPLASIIQEALEGYATGRFATQSEVKHWLEGQPEFPKKKGTGEVILQKVTDLLSHPLYAGYVVSKARGVSLRKGQHEGLISFETFQRIQERRAEAAHAPKRKNIGETFALRGFVTCGDCEKPLRSCHSTSVTGKRHAYYLCQNRGCASYGKSIRQAVIEGEFETLLETMRPTKHLFALARAMFEDAWAQRMDQMAEMRKALKAQIMKAETQIDEFAERVIATTSEAAIRAIERKIDDLEKQRIVADEKLTKMAAPANTRRRALELAFGFLSNPSKIWASGGFEAKRLVLKLAFSERLPYCRKDGYRTAKTTLPFKVLGQIQGQNEEMVPAAGLEPA